MSQNKSDYPLDLLRGINPLIDNTKAPVSFLVEAIHYTTNEIPWNGRSMSKQSSVSESTVHEYSQLLANADHAEIVDRQSQFGRPMNQYRLTKKGHTAAKNEYSRLFNSCKEAFRCQAGCPNDYVADVAVGAAFTYVFGDEEDDSYPDPRKHDNASGFDTRRIDLFTAALMRSLPHDQFKEIEAMMQ